MNGQRYPDPSVSSTSEGPTQSTSTEDSAVMQPNAYSVARVSHQMDARGALPKESCDPDQLGTLPEMFKRRRLKLGYTQTTVGLSMGRLYGKVLSESTIRRFETRKLTPKGMSKHKKSFEDWIRDMNETYIACLTDGSTAPNALIQKRNQPTLFTLEQIQALEQAFLINQKLKSDALASISSQTGLPKRIVLNWFQNRYVFVILEVQNF